MVAARLARVFRAAQSHLPVLRTAKFAAYNFATRRFGLHVEEDFKLLARLSGVGLAIDVGGNWGQSVAALERYAKPDRIVSFEPNPALSRRLIAQAAHHPGLTVEAVGLGSEAGAFALHVPRYRNYIYDGLASLDEEAARSWLNPERVAWFDPAHLHIDRYMVDVRTLDSFALVPDIVKIDVQGRELDVVRGGAETFRGAGPSPSSNRRSRRWSIFWLAGGWMPIAGTARASCRAIPAG